MEKINKIYRRILRMHMDKEYQRRIKNKDCSIISMNCVGGGGGVMNWDYDSTHQL